MKKIIVCCDGTWNKPDTYQKGVLIKTNVQKIYQAISEKEEDKQVKFYDPGVGTGFSLRDTIFGGAFGSGIDRNIQDAYKFLMWNYQKGDQIYLYGFSRGAYTVRSLAGLIRNSGILKPVFLHLVEEAYSLYRDKTSLTHPDTDTMKGFRKTYAIQEDTPVYFIGIWDTVGALGIPVTSLSWFNRKYHFHDVKLSSRVKYAYHALALDERRKIFQPTLWEVSEKPGTEEEGQICEQVWFAGAHSNVGGGYADSGLSDIALKWMVEKSRATDIVFKEEAINEIKADSCGAYINSASGLFALTPKLAREINKGTVWKKDPATGKMVEVQVRTNESLHYTCLERCSKQKAYRPPNLYSAFKANTPYDPLEDKWEEGWREYLKIKADYERPVHKKFSLGSLKKIFNNLFC